jgi:protein phosphatase
MGERVGPLHSSQLTIAVSARSDQGQVRSNNEDSYAFFLPPTLPAGLNAVLVVADGMGGYRGGEVASAMVVDAFADSLRGDSMRAGPGEETWELVLERIIQAASAAILAKAASTTGLQGMGTTVVAAVLAGRRLHIAHVGDSRAYLVGQANVCQLTQDHSWVADAVREGVLTTDEARQHPRRNLLTRVVGRQPAVVVDFDVADVHSGDYLVLCTDGLSNLVSETELADVVRRSIEPTLAATALVDLAKQRGAPDNVTVVVARVDPVLAQSNGIDEAIAERY